MPGIDFGHAEFYSSLLDVQQGLLTDLNLNARNLAEAYELAVCDRDQRLKAILDESNSDICSRADLHHPLESAVGAAADFRIHRQTIKQGMNGNISWREYLFKLCFEHYPKEPNYESNYGHGEALENQSGPLTKFIPEALYPKFGLPILLVPPKLEVWINSFIQRS